MADLVYPAPVKRCRDKVTGKMLEFYFGSEDDGYDAIVDDCYFAMKVNEELAEALAEQQSLELQENGITLNVDEYFKRTQKEIVDIITVCHSWLHCVYGLTDVDISKLIEETNVATIRLIQMNEKDICGKTHKK